MYALLNREQGLGKGLTSRQRRAGILVVWAASQSIGERDCSRLRGSVCVCVARRIHPMRAYSKIDQVHGSYARGKDNGYRLVERWTPR